MPNTFCLIFQKISSKGTAPRNSRECGRANCRYARTQNRTRENEWTSQTSSRFQSSARHCYPFRFSNRLSIDLRGEQQEAGYLMGQLSVRGLVMPITGSGGVHVTATGYEKIEELEAASYKSSRNAFVAMWFDNRLIQFTAKQSNPQFATPVMSRSASTEDRSASTASTTRSYRS